MRYLLQHYDPTHLLFLDNDMTVEPDFLEPLVDATRSPSGPTLATGKIRDIEMPERLYGAGGCRIRFWCGDTMHVGHMEMDHGQYDAEVDCIPSGGCLMIRRARPSSPGVCVGMCVRVRWCAVVCRCGCVRRVCAGVRESTCTVFVAVPGSEAYVSQQGVMVVQDLIVSSV